MTPRPPIRAGHGNRRRRPPAQAAARRHARWLLLQLRRGLVVLRQLPGRFRARVDWKQSVGHAGQAVAARGRALVPAARRALEGVGKGMERGAAELGRSAVAGSRGLRRLSHLGARAFAQTSLAARGLARASLRGARRAAAGGAWLAGAGARGARRLAGDLWTRRAFLRAFGLRAAWWSALALLCYGGRAVLDLQGPLAGVLPIFLLGLGLCLPLLLAGAARLRWAGFALGASHAVLAVVVWTVATSG